ncbi:hypothetical protein ACI7YW_09815 [Clostridium ljungdahlii]|uniref:hypothetical protein n=1 Tax=Clostridium ljungdahlii TaxID=1538 RepID=UPI00386CC01F
MKKVKTYQKIRKYIYRKINFADEFFTEIVSRMSLKDCDKEALDKEYQCIAKQLNKM